MTISPQRLLERLFDYAGVFPPADHTVADATDRYEIAAHGADGWVIGPMLLRASQVDEYTGHHPLGLVMDVDPSSIDAPVTILQAEGRVAPDVAADTIDELATVAPVVYVESTDSEDLSIVDAVAAARTEGVDARAKIRTGGATAEAFPSAEQTAAFVVRCVDRMVPFKATAGLHHPFRHESIVPDATEHGFVNLMAAVRCALEGRYESVAPALEETDAAAFEVTTMTWRGVGGDVSPSNLRTILRSIGSCSFDEPTGYLRDLGLLSDPGGNAP